MRKFRLVSIDEHALHDVCACVCVCREIFPSGVPGSGGMPGNRVSRGPGVAGSGERLCFWGPKRLSWGPGVAGGGDNNIAGGPGVAGGGDNNISWGPGVASTRERRGTGPGVWGRRGDKKIAGGQGVPGSRKLAPGPGSQREYVSELLGNRGSIL